MPQMSPMNWIILFMLFNVTVFLIIVKLYFMPSLKFLTSFKTLNSNNNNNLNNPKTSFYTWKW